MSAILGSKLKEAKPPTAYACALVDTASQKIYFKLFNDVIQSSADPNYVERIAHLILVAGKLKGATVTQVLLPLVEQVTGGDKISEQMTKLNNTMEETSEKIEKTKKHPDNEEFIQLMQELESQCEEAAQLELKALQAIVKEIDEDELQQAALTFEKAKLECSLVPCKPEV